MLIQDQFGNIQKPSDVPYSPNKFLGWDFFEFSYSKIALVNQFINHLPWTSNTVSHLMPGKERPDGNACVRCCILSDVTKDKQIAFRVCSFHDNLVPFFFETTMKGNQLVCMSN